MRTLLALALGLAAAACAHPPMQPDASASLAAAETAFGRHSVREDMRVAFLAAFADDGVFVRNGWTNSNAYLRDRPAPPIVLDWHPQYVEVAASGDLGLSTGPWKITSKADPSLPSTHGQFVSVWRRVGSGPWRVEVDLGIGHPGAWLWDAQLDARQSPGIAAAGESLAAAEARFARDSLERGVRSAYSAHGARDLRFYRSGQAPAAALDAALASPVMSDTRITWSAERQETARSGEFGYARGSYALATAPGTVAGWYLRVWRREPAGWRIVLDVTNAPAPGS
ncbi:MAG TPA: nuclear transport factor 2 family protein [Usitatibacter sp.]|nr:nuclear transport factor 2 family protein [Usitatibacter sp.]